MNAVATHALLVTLPDATEGEALDIARSIEEHLAPTPSSVQLTQHVDRTSLAEMVKQYREDERAVRDLPSAGDDVPFDAYPDLLDYADELISRMASALGLTIPEMDPPA